MNVEIITIGDELLIGQVIDTNSTWMGAELNSAGFDVTQKTVVSDDATGIKESLKGALSRVDIVLITGGLGPTKDDITKRTLADYFKSSLVYSSDVYNDVESFLNSQGQGINNLNREQAMVPDNCIVIRNRIGTAPIMWFEVDNKVVVSMPGVPHEMKKAMADSIIPKLLNRFNHTTILHKTVSVSGIPESDLAIKIAPWEVSLPGYISLAYLPSPVRVRLRLTGKGRPTERMESDMLEAIEELKTILGRAIWSVDDELPEEVVGKMLLANNQTISCAESCTGGNIAHHLTKHAGSSAFYLGGVVAYHNSVKEGVLGVKPRDLEAFGAVSQAVVEQMAIGVKDLMKTDWAVATSGIAGPGGGTPDKPVGTVWIAWAGPRGVKSKLFQFGLNREVNIKSATEVALAGLLQY